MKADALVNLPILAVSIIEWAHRAVPEHLSNAQMVRVYDAERQSALERWGARIMELMTGKRPKAEVVDLRGGRG